MELLFFRDKAVLDNFKAPGNSEFSAQASAVIATNGAAAKTSYNDNGVAVFVHIKGGAMVAGLRRRTAVPVRSGARRLSPSAIQRSRRIARIRSVPQPDVVSVDHYRIAQLQKRPVVLLDIAFGPGIHLHHDLP